MKIQKSKTIEVDMDIDVSVKRVGLYFNREGITAMVEMEGAADVDDDDEVLISWERLESCALASCQEFGDCESICEELRHLADKLQKWSGR